MAEEGTDLKLAVETAQAEQNQEKTGEAPAPTAEEETAAKGGWVPEAEFEGEGWIDAKEFNGRKPLYEGLSKQSKRIKNLEGIVKTLADQNKEVEKVALDRAKAQLKAERVKAHEEEDYNKVVELEDKQRELDEKEKLANDDVVAADQAAFLAWESDNDWFNTDKKAKRYATAYGNELAQTDHGLTSEQFYERIGEEVREAFPNLFSKKLPDRGAAPGAGKTTGGKGTAATYAMLSQDQKKVCREFVSMGHMTQEDYVKQLDEMGLIEKG